MTPLLRTCYHVALTCMFLANVPQIAPAQPVPSEDSARIVAQVTDAFFAQLTQEDFDAERAFLADSVTDEITPELWRALREKFIAQSGPTPLFLAHKLTFYQQDTLLAAVDYAAKAAQPDTYICGYVLWSFSGEDSLGLTRFEQSIIETQVFQKMELQEASQLMTQWQCPNAVIEAILGVALLGENQ